MVERNFTRGRNCFHMRPIIMFKLCLSFPATQWPSSSLSQSTSCQYTVDGNTIRRHIGTLKSTVDADKCYWMSFLPLDLYFCMGCSWRTKSPWEALYFRLQPFSPTVSEQRHDAPTEDYNDTDWGLLNLAKLNFPDGCWPNTRLKSNYSFYSVFQIMRF